MAGATAKVLKMKPPSRRQQALDLLEERKAVVDRMKELDAQKADLDARLFPLVEGAGDKLALGPYTASVVRQNTTRTDYDTFAQELVKAGVAPTKVEKARQAATVTTPKKPFLQVRMKEEG